MNSPTPSIQPPQHWTGSTASYLASLPEDLRLRILRKLPPDELKALEFNWQFWGRPNQQEPQSDYRYWVLNAGRGYGKTRTGAETVRSWAERKAHGGVYALVGPTSADVRDTMIEGESGILQVSPPWFRPEWYPSKRRLRWPNGAIAITYSAEKPERLRGPNIGAAWCDELCAWKYMKETWSQLRLTMRKGSGRPRTVITTTPRPVELYLKILSDPACITTKGSTFENKANLAPGFIEELIQDFVGTRLGQQELYADILTDVQGALWTHALIDDHRIKSLDMSQLVRVVVAIDPAVKASMLSDETGIIVAGRFADGHGVVLEDLSVRGAQPMDWMQRAVNAYHKWRADAIVAEVNNGGDLIEELCKVVDKTVKYKAVHASRGKFTRAEPVAGLYEQFRIHHYGIFKLLEEQMRTYSPVTAQKSPDRMDALVWAFTELFLQKKPAPLIVSLDDDRIQISPY